MQGCGGRAGAEEQVATSGRGTEREGTLSRTEQAIAGHLTVAPEPESVLCTGTGVGVSGVLNNSSVHLGHMERDGEKT